jgi:predicted secreted protein
MRTGIGIIAIGALALAVAHPLAAGDASTFGFIGFSQDGKTCAFETYGVSDGSGFPYASVYFIDVDTNEWAAKPVQAEVRDSGAESEAARAEALRKAEPSLKKLGLAKPRAGKLLFSEPADDHEADIALPVGSRRLVLVESETGASEGEEPTSVFELDLMDGPMPMALQKDGTLPASRGAAFAYALDRCFGLGDRIAVVIRYERRGFEGPDTRYLVVTGKAR